MPDLGERLRTFRNHIARVFRADLSRLEIKLDSTQDLRRMVRIYGTVKPAVGKSSRFYGGRRVEDVQFLPYLIEHCQPTRRAQPSDDVAIVIGKELPPWFAKLLREDNAVRQLWHGTGKTAGTDQSGSGYDFTIIRTLSQRGHTNAHDLATILALRPGGGAAHGKDQKYIRRTIQSALLRSPR